MGMGISWPTDPTLNRRHLLVDEQNGTIKKRQVTWNTSNNRADRYNEKARLQHVELVVVRILHERNNTAVRQSRGYEWT